MKPPALPIAPAEYSADYINQLVRILTQYLTQQDISMATYLTTADYYNPLLIAAGLIAGKSEQRQLGTHPGVNNVMTDMCNFVAAGASYAFPAAGGIQMRVVSASANDTAAGTGVRTVEINYLDAAYLEKTEVVIMNGVTPVNTVATNILRINKFHTVTAGTGLVAAGNISLQAVGGAVTYAQIPVTLNEAFNAVYTVPAGTKLFLTDWDFSAGTAAGTHYTQAFIRATCTHNGVLTPGIFQTIDATGVLNGATLDDIFVPRWFPAQCDLKISTISDAGAANAICTTNFGGWTEPA